jgi:hypothetical protein
MGLSPEAAQPREETLALVPKLGGGSELADPQLYAIITFREQLHLSWDMIPMRLRYPKSTVKSAYKR